MGIRLCNENLPQLKAVADVPAYDRSQMSSGILHIGPSAFARAHLFQMADDILSRQAKEGRPLDWGITAVSLKKPDARDKLSPQDYLYTVTSKGNGSSRPRIIGSLRDVMVAQDNPDAVIEAAADPAIKMISLTVTQEGYYFDKDRGVDFDADDIKACLDESSASMSAIGLLVKSLDVRRQRGIEPPLILSCDNLSGNGTKLRNAVLAYAGAKNPELKRWISEFVTFPDNMVDRITPKTTPEHTSLIETMGISDNWAIQAEPMPNLPLVIGQKSGANGLHEAIADLQSVGAKVTDEVFPYEALKVRTLNGVHMALGCIGHLSGAQYSHEAMSNPDIRGFAQGFMREVGATLQDTPGVCHDAFRADVERRLDNAQICDQLTRLSRNGSEKAATRFLSSARDIISQDLGADSYAHLSFAVASWVEYMKELDPTGRFVGTPATEDPNDVSFVSSGLSNLISRDMIDPSPIFAIRKIFGNDLASHADFQNSVRNHLTTIHTLGMKKALETFVQTRAFNASNQNDPDADHQPQVAPNTPKPATQVYH